MTTEENEIKDVPEEFMMTPEEGQACLNKILEDKTGAYYGNTFGERHSTEDSDKALFKANFLRQKIAEGKRFDASEWIRKYEAERKQTLKDTYGDPTLGESRSGKAGLRFTDEGDPILF